MDDKSTTYSIYVPIQINSETNNSTQLNIAKVKLEEIAILVDESVQHEPSVGPVFDQLISSADNLMESSAPSQKSLIQQTKDKIIPVGHENLIESESKDLVMRDLSKFLTEEPSQNVGPPFINVKPEYIKNGKQKKIKNLENTLDENKSDQKDTNKYENNITDALSTLATSAINQAPSTNGSADSFMAKPTQPIVHVEQETPAWCDVGIVKGNTCMVKQFYSTSITNEHENTRSDNLPDYKNTLKIDIQPGTAYKVRIAAINNCGRGEWSDISVFGTCLPGYPNAPSAVKITKGLNGANLKWEPPSTSSSEILEYTVCMAIPNNGTPQNPKPTETNLNFVRVYCGPQNAVLVSNESLSAAFIDRTNKPAIIFQIVAKNEKGYGPALQVKWLQDDNVPGLNKNTPAKKRRI